MDKDKGLAGRRAFLKAALAAAATAGLSHFRFLNIGGTGVARAQYDECRNLGPGTPSTDQCAPPADPDQCPVPPYDGSDVCLVSEGDPDVCLPGEPLFEPDECVPPASPADVCDPGVPPQDTCDPAGGDPDACEGDPSGSFQSPDTCDPAAGDPDTCNFATGADSDVCPDPLGDGDVCVPEQNEQDFCYASGADDICAEPTGPAPDWCDPQAVNPDQPTAIRRTGLDARSGDDPAVTWSLLGGLAVALGAATLWLRKRLGPDKPEAG